MVASVGLQGRRSYSVWAVLVCLLSDQRLLESRKDYGLVI